MVFYVLSFPVAYSIDVLIPFVQSTLAIPLFQHALPSPSTQRLDELGRDSRDSRQRACTESLAIVGYRWLSLVVGIVSRHVAARRDATGPYTFQLGTVLFVEWDRPH